MNGLELNPECIEALDSVGVKTLAQIRILLMCDPDNPARAKDLCNEFGYTPSYASGYLSRYHREGLITPVDYRDGMDTGGRPTKRAWIRSPRVDSVFVQFDIKQALA